MKASKIKLKNISGGGQGTQPDGVVTTKATKLVAKQRRHVRRPLSVDSAKEAVNKASKACGVVFERYAEMTECKQ